MNDKKAFAILGIANKDNPEAVEALRHLATRMDRYSEVLSIIQSSLGQLRTDMKYIIFDRDCLKAERDEALARLGE